MFLILSQIYRIFVTTVLISSILWPSTYHSNHLVFSTLYSCGPFSVSCGPSVLPQIYNRFVVESIGIRLISLVSLDLSGNEGEHLRDDGQIVRVEASDTISFGQGRLYQMPECPSDIVAVTGEVTFLSFRCPFYVAFQFLVDLLYFFSFIISVLAFYPLQVWHIIPVPKVFWGFLVISILGRLLVSLKSPIRQPSIS